MIDIKIYLFNSFMVKYCLLNSKLFKFIFTYIFEILVHNLFYCCAYPIVLKVFGIKLYMNILKI
jgi:hypothetical protein